MGIGKVKVWQSSNSVFRIVVRDREYGRGIVELHTAEGLRESKFERNINIVPAHSACINVRQPG